MQGLRITNIFSEYEGDVDYKGLNIKKFVPGSQIYPTGEQVCYVITNEENIPEHADILRITTDEYEAAREKYIVNPVRPPSPEQQQIDALQATVLGLMAQIAGGDAK
ncbi:hypothetical protein [Paenibacillus sp. NAIST15-1]|uniref:hypothetical protein n=1 Tax=Paenibacillus sp. NAIST15-1 TaxID=1605994 RepID=UPI00086E38AE|nr:hypothetical protein [Paenibacillus sp. NAIST15-1]GAV13226.1 hypothetical protein PBN151_3160 [Paenibacillus sp. NAIST15-1]